MATLSVDRNSDSWVQLMVHDNLNMAKFSPNDWTVWLSLVTTAFLKPQSCLPVIRLKCEMMIGVFFF